MTDQDLFRTFFFINKKEISIHVRNTSNFGIAYIKKKKLIKDNNYFNNDDLDSFFLENIEKIENQIQIFVKNISLIIEDDNIFSIKICLKQKIENRVISKEEFENLLLIGLEQVNKYSSNLYIVHYIADLLRVDDQIVDSIENREIKSNLCVDLRFICIDQKFVTQFRDLFKKKHVLLQKIFSWEYLRKYAASDGDIINSLVKIEEGLNKSEVKLIPKKPEKKGFFEKFFSYFS